MRPGQSLLSLACILLHADAARPWRSGGLDVELGIFHEPFRDRESLACDLAELLRPAVDRWVVGLFRRRTLRPEHFSVGGGACLLGKTARRDFYKAYETAAGP